MASKTGICQLCDKNKELRKSHAIPSAFFKELLKDGKAKLFDLKTKHNPRNFGNNAKDYLLCGDCEQILNKCYETKVIGLLKNRIFDKSNSSIHIGKHGHTFKLRSKNLSSLDLINFIISILWRAALLDEDFYERFDLKPIPSFVDWMKDIVKENEKPSSRLISIEINALLDSSNTLPNSELNQIIVQPFAYQTNPRPVIAMIFGGYIFKISIPGKQANDRKNQLTIKTKIYLARYQEILSIPIVKDILSY